MLNSINSSMSLAGAACFAMSAVAARKFVAAGACKSASKVMALFGKQNEALDKAGQAYLAQAKKDAFRDFKVVVGFAAVGVAATYAGPYVENALKNESKTESYYEKAFNVANEYKKSIAFGTVGIVGCLKTAHNFRALSNYLNLKYNH